MKSIHEFLLTTELFRGFEADDIGKMLSCLNPYKKSYKKDEVIVSEGSNLDVLGLVLSGQVHVEHEDYWGNRSILGIIGVGDIFGEAYTMPESEPIPNFIIAARDTEVVFLDTKNILTMCSTNCHFHNQLIQNLFVIIAGKNRSLAGKIRHMSRRSTREKLLSYLLDQSILAGNDTFDIPFNRQQLADYLAVDRSAMSAELSKMQKEGLIQFKKNHFKLLRHDNM